VLFPHLLILSLVFRIARDTVNLVSAPATYLLSSTSPSQSLRQDIMSKGYTLVKTVGTEAVSLGSAMWNAAAGVYRGIRDERLQEKDQRIKQEQEQHELMKEKEKKEKEQEEQKAKQGSNSIIQPCDGAYEPKSFQFLFSAQLNI